VGSGLRYFGGAVAFGFAAVWIMQSLAAALVCLLAAAAGYAAVLVAERTRARLTARVGSPGIATPNTTLPRRTLELEDLSRQADELNHDLGHVYEPTVAMPPRAAEADGSTPNDKASRSGEAAH
jgi:hypothetical protein